MSDQSKADRIRIRRVFAGFESRDATAFSIFVTNDVQLRPGNAVPGRERSSSLPPSTVLWFRPPAFGTRS